MDTTPERFEEIRKFCAGALNDAAVDPKPAAADADFRRYWRVSSHGTTFILMDARTDKIDVRPWLDVDRRLRDANLHAPEVFDENVDRGLVLMSDLGSRLYLWELAIDTVDALYDDAMKALATMQTRADVAGLPSYDDARLRAELELMPTWFLQRHLDVQAGCRGWDLIEDAFTHLIGSALEQPQAFVHRDYHSRNLLIVPGANPGMVDFQDAVVGPITYDLVSLLRDCYIEWPSDQVYAWANAHRDRLVDRGVLKFGELRWRRWFDWMGVQRHLKVLGIFCRLWYRDGKNGYLKDLPLVLKYTIEVCARYKELQPFSEWLARHTESRDLTLPRERVA
jgi:aminoglycoside/choline kinase family phosphotransferase